MLIKIFSLFGKVILYFINVFLNGLYSFFLFCFFLSSDEELGELNVVDEVSFVESNFSLVDHFASFSEVVIFFLDVDCFVRMRYHCNNEIHHNNEQEDLSNHKNHPSCIND